MPAARRSRSGLRTPESRTWLAEAWRAGYPTCWPSLFRLAVLDPLVTAPDEPLLAHFARAHDADGVDRDLGRGERSGCGRSHWSLCFSYDGRLDGRGSGCGTQERVPGRPGRLDDLLVAKIP